ncbi:hypothetical protein CBR_g52569 [Chara braunii]|uniref:Uncharacterized protein n=1 Tax=Chara braunii TaxID=69332 RepID=A0A388MAJ3_CHABU|nr:hypothetical protein CBR_g52569 [Chara braunii]|eukprot:GBG91535.1 hypothetical protein CBR_g52569 [Chara braunii]
MLLFPIKLRRIGAMEQQMGSLTPTTTTEAITTAEEREQRKRETAQLASLEEEKKRNLAEEAKRAEEKKARESQEARLGHIVRSSMKVVCESALGRKVDLPGDEESEVSKLRKELDELKSKCGGNVASSSSSSLEVLRKEKEALLKVHDQSSEEQRLRKEIEDLKAKINGHQPDKSQDEVLTLKLQVAELERFRKALEEKSSEVATLKAKNLHLHGEFKELREEISTMREGCNRAATGVVETSPVEAPSRGKVRIDDQPQAMYTPKDLEALQKAYKNALVAKEMALREAEACKEKMARMGATKYRLSTRKTASRRTTPRNLKTTMNFVDVASDEEKEEGEPKEADNERPLADVAHELEVAMMAKFRDKRLKELRTGKKADLEKNCLDEGISYIKLDHAKADVAEIKAQQDFDEWLLEKKANGEEDEAPLDYATSTEDIHDE